jgi:uncharacterized membrane protein YfcA
MPVAGYIASFIMGTSLGLIGAGGSILTVPILFYFFGQSSLQATTNSLFIVGVAAFIGAVIQARAGNINFRTSMLFAPPSFAGVYVARQFLLPILPETIFAGFGITVTKSLLVMATFAGLMLVSSWKMIRPEPHRSNLEPSGTLSVGGKGFLVGVITGFVGAGGGFLIIPALIVLLKFPLNQAVGTSFAIIAANSLFAFAISFPLVRFEDCPLLLTMCILAVAGILFGQLLSLKISAESLKRGFGYFVLIIASVILIDQGMRL